MPIALLVPAAVALVLLVLHARVWRGGGTAADFFGLAFVYFVAKENLSVAGYFHRYFYASEPVLRLGAAPLGVVVGWLFTSYVAWTLAERLLARFPGARGGWVHTVFVAMLVAASISYPMEAVGTALGWWRWTVDGVPWVVPAPGEGGHAWVTIPPVPLFGWAVFVGGFLFWWGTSARWLARWPVLRWLAFGAGTALHFQAIHGDGGGPELLFGVLMAAFLVSVVLLRPAAGADGERRIERPSRAAFGAQPWPVRHAIEIGLGLMATVLLSLVALRTREPDHLLTLVPLTLFWVATLPVVPRRALALGWALEWLIGLATFSPKVFTLGLYPWLFFTALAGRVAVAWLRRRAAGMAAWRAQRSAGASPAPHS